MNRLRQEIEEKREKQMNVIINGVPYHIEKHTKDELIHAFVNATRDAYGRPFYPYEKLTLKQLNDDVSHISQAEKIGSYTSTC